jgi:hypothetical protein
MAVASSLRGATGVPYVFGHVENLGLAEPRIDADPESVLDHDVGLVRAPKCGNYARPEV